MPVFFLVTKKINRNREIFHFRILAINHHLKYFAKQVNLT